MFIYQGRTKATIMVDNVDPETMSQIASISNHPAFKEDCVIMPDCHAGKGCVIGYTRKLENDIVPNLVGVDIGCGMLTVKFKGLDAKSINFEQFDRHVKQSIPMGHSTNEKDTLKKVLPTKDYYDLCRKLVDNDPHKFGKLWERVSSSIGTLGGGNHFIEMDTDTDGNVYATVHSGSRYLGKVVAEYFQHKAVKFCKDMKFGVSEEQSYLPLEYGGDDYIAAMVLSQKYSSVNREMMIASITKFFADKYKVEVEETIESIHNYIDFNDKILRKGAISAQNGKKLIIPLNMRDGIILGTGKGNPDWNWSAPHGAGRIMSRGQAKRFIKLEDFQKSMEGIYSSTVCQDTLDESPFTYKDSSMIIEAIGDTVDIEKIITPIYNVKSSGE